MYKSGGKGAYKGIIFCLDAGTSKWAYNLGGRGI